MSEAHRLVSETDSLGALRNADRLWHLRHTGLTEGLTLKEMHRLALACHDALLSKEKKFYRQGAEADALLLINRGTVRLSVTNSQGREKIVGFLGSGELFGEEVLGAGPTRQSQAVAHEETWISILERESLSSLMKEIPSFSRNLMQVLCLKLARARNEIETLSFNDTEKRIAKTLLDLSERHGMKIMASENLRKLRIPVSHEYLSQIIGANRPHVSAIMSEFKKKGWIDYHKRKLLINVDQMSDLVGART